MTRKALLVGINDYAPVGSGGSDLHSCVNDVRDMANTLSVLNIVPATSSAMRIITDARATRATIIDGLNWLIVGAKKDDVLFFFYSGHGSQVVDVSKDELGKKDETICPYDYSTTGMIKDTYYRSLLVNQPAGVDMDVILDSGHSGTGRRGYLLRTGALLPTILSFRQGGMRISK